MKTSIIRATILALVVGAPLGLALAKDPVQNIDPKRHPNLAAAQQLSAQSFDRLIAAQLANEWDLGGHAAKAKGLLVQANDEMKAAALASNQKAAP
jgi:hypothetical protein